MSFINKKILNKTTGLLGTFLAYSHHVTSLKAIIMRPQAVHNSPNAPMCEVYKSLVHLFPKGEML